MRLPEVSSRDALPEDKRHIYDYLAETRGAVRPPFSVLLNHPDVCYLVSQVGTFARFKSELTKDVIETATLTAAREFDCRFEWAAHVPQARNAASAKTSSRRSRVKAATSRSSATKKRS